MCRTRFALVLTVISTTVLASSPSSAGKRIAVFPLLTKDAPDALVVEAVVPELQELSHEVTGVTLLTEAELRPVLKHPVKAIRRCGSNLNCLAALGKRLEAQEVIVGQARGPNATAISFLVVGVASASVERSVTVEVATPALVRDALRTKLVELLGAPLAEAKPAPATAAVAPRVDPMLPPESMAPPAAVVAPLPTERAWLAPARRYGGLALSGAAVAAIVAGGVLGSRAQSSRGDLDRSWTQIDAAAQLSRAESQAGTANVLFLAGGLAACAAAGLLTWEWLSWSAAPGGGG